MKRFYKKRLLYVLGGLFVLIAINLFITFSYFEAEIFGNESESTINLDIGYMTIRYDNFSGTIVANGIYPGWTTTKTFSVTGTIPEQMLSEKYSEAYYAVKLVLDKNGLLDDSMVYTLTLDAESDTTGFPISVGVKTGIPSKSTANQVVLGYGSLPKGETVHKYNLNLEYLNRDDVDQTNEMGAEFAAHLIIESVDQSGLVNIDLNLDGGTFASGASISRVYGKNAIVVLEVPTKERYEHIGWEVTSGNASVSGNEITLGEGDVLVKALWKNVIPDAKSFATDDWETIAYYAQHPVDDKTPYAVGATREISLSGYTNGEVDSGGKYTIRIANNSNYDCTLESKTACGFVLEFQDIITKHRMNPSGQYNGTNYNYGYNLGGWGNSELYDYVKTDIYNALPSDLRAVIIDTEVISGHGSADSNSNRTDGNWTSTDKLYLLSTKEVWSNCTQSNCNDTATEVTRQLDYYESKGVTTSSYSEAIKLYNGSSSWWWLRSARSNYNNVFISVNNSGDYYSYDSPSVGGVAPAFRIG